MLCSFKSCGAHVAGELPSSFPQRRLKVDFSRVDMSQRLDTLLNGLLQPAWEDRLTAAQAQAVLSGKTRSNEQQQQHQRDRSGWDMFGQDGQESGRERSRHSGRGRQVRHILLLLCSTQKRYAGQHAVRPTALTTLMMPSR